jgi:hypothetical protein
VDEEDRYGGKVTLTDAGPMENLRSGQMVRVEGRLADAEAHDLRPAYKVQAIKLVRD